MRWRIWAATCAAAGATVATSLLVESSDHPDNRTLLRTFVPNGECLRDRISRLTSSSSPSLFTPLKTDLSPAKVSAATPLDPADCSKSSSADADSSFVQKWDDNWDLRDPEFLGLTEFPKATRNLILIRHGQYHIEQDDDAERKLTVLGRKQLQLTGERLKELSCQLNMKYDKIFVSTMTRALESADIISQSLPEVSRELPGDALLREGSPYPPEPPNWDVVKSRERTAKKLQNYFIDGPRIESAFRKYFHRASYDQKEDSTEIVVCHANVIRYFVMRALQLPPEAWLRMSLKNGSITVVVISPHGKVSLRTLGDAGHMPPHCLTTT